MLIWAALIKDFIWEIVQNFQKKAPRIVSFSDSKEPLSTLFKEWRMLKIRDILEIQIAMPFQLLFPQGKAT